ncbi:hypothetical protein A3Q56_04311 [Intoshia linei]|uniref:Uncharacterized protein n=1 Tax=Intoshia linei TaxID=1819745 RepID=A0A177B119_9BILA|nr:hypothetical protein A3Q56_04311 [Intoshia linei]
MQDFQVDEIFKVRLYYAVLFDLLDDKNVFIENFQGSVGVSFTNRYVNLDYAKLKLQVKKGSETLLDLIIDSIDKDYYLFLT